ncbi:MAG: flippase-like domain-containing protein [Phycisphaeraceae bacterium]|nr:flippase-like domain-containing protein [Phycisphaeraceae bacterium]MCW5762130.1 flippase-like domain-containing protein [Phycisphaeraceae bacterium]
MRGERSRWRIAVQVVGFLIGLGLLGWCVRVALSEANREQLGKLIDADWGLVVALAACSAGTLMLNGLVFLAALWPVKRLAVLDVLAVNSVATVLSYAPFKLALAFRVVYHVKRDRVPLLTVIGWFGAVAVLAAVAVGPAFGASLVLPGGSGLWWAGWLGGAAAATAVMVGLARVFGGERGWARLLAFVRAVGFGWLLRWLGGEAGRKVHAGVDMLAHGRASAAGAVLRVGDIMVQAVRMGVAARILGIELDWGDAMVLASVYFAIGMISPFGMLGTREAGAAGVATLAGLSGASGVEAVVTISLLVTASEAVVNLAGGALGAAWLRVDRWVRGGR